MNRIGHLLMVLGVLCIAAAVCLVVYNESEEKYAQKSVDFLLPELEAQMDVMDAVHQEPLTAAEVWEHMPAAHLPIEGSVEIDGYSYIGYLSVPSLGLELPIMDRWDYERLKTAPCRHTGTVAENNLVIAGHNYRKHFGNIRTLSVKDSVYFTDIQGNVFHYCVASVEEVSAFAVEDVLGGEWDLTLYTCTYGGQNRIVVRCDRADNT